MKVETNKSFATRECPSCGCDVPENNNVCPICKYHFPVATPRQKHMKLWGAVIMLGLILFYFVLR